MEILLVVLHVRVVRRVHYDPTYVCARLFHQTTRDRDKQCAVTVLSRIDFTELFRFEDGLKPILFALRLLLAINYLGV